MLKRRHIREAAVQLLYFADLEGGPEVSDAQDAFWQIIQEGSLRKLTMAKAKAVLHIAQGRESRIKRLAEECPLVLAQLKAVEGTTPLATALRKINSQESKLSSAIDLLKTATRSKSGEDIVETRLQEVFVASRALPAVRLHWDYTLQDFPAWRNKLEAMTAIINHLERISDRLDAIHSPEFQTPGIPGFEHLRAGEKEIRSFREETEKLVQGILANKADIDATLTSIVENYAPERVAPVDRAILRLGAYEILHCEDIPRAVSINEAIEIAKKFGGSDSSRFVNGVLDALKA
ncbi:transcription antitermination factor NusB [Verrucomicrobiaceae bacterium R5-34]|nr:transcription antitermination factor NusB [Verrucomicrobiaceae bacterium R5-34]